MKRALELKEHEEQEIKFENQWKFCIDQPKGIMDLDPKHSIDFNIKTTTQQPTILSQHGIIQIQDIIPLATLSEIIKKIEESKKFQRLDYGLHRERLITFETKKNIVRLLENIITRQDVQTAIQDANIVPYGFSTYNMKVPQAINPCLRFNKYKRNDGRIGWHRDAQFTGPDTQDNKHVRSNMTLLLYLNDSLSVTRFYTKLDTNVTPGMTIEQETQNLDPTCYFDVVNRAGTVVLFDQRLLHCSTPTNTTKYVLRTDVFDAWEPTTKMPLTVKNAQVFCKQLFRQAQLCELERKESNDLYEAVISMRSFNWSTYPEIELPTDLKGMIKPFLFEPDDGQYCLQLQSRSGRQYVFGYTNDFTEELLHLAVLIVFVFEARKMPVEWSTKDMIQMIRSTFGSSLEMPLEMVARKKARTTSDSDSDSDSDSEVDLYEIDENDEGEMIELEEKTNNKQLNVGVTTKSRNVLGFTQEVFHCQELRTRECYCFARDSGCEDEPTGDDWKVVNTADMLNASSATMLRIKTHHREDHRINGIAQVLTNQSRPVHHASCNCDNVYTKSATIETKTTTFNYYFLITNNQIKITTNPNITL